MTDSNNDNKRWIKTPDGRIIELPEGRDPMEYTAELSAEQLKKDNTPSPPLPDKSPSLDHYTKPQPEKPPSLFKMVKGFVKEVAKYVAEGAPNVSPEVYFDRLEACDSCPHFLRESVRCGLCGCLIEHKAKWQTTECPDSPPRWEKIKKCDCKKDCNCNDKRQENNNPETGNQA